MKTERQIQNRIKSYEDLFPLFEKNGCSTDVVKGHLLALKWVLGDDL